MLRFRWFTLIALLLVSIVSWPAHAINLHWSTGGTTLSSPAASRCTLVVETSPSENHLPPEWRLQWAADSCEIEFLPLECLADIANISRVSQRAERAALLEHRVDAEFCSSGSEPALTAWFVFDVPAGARGSFKVIALDPADPESLRVLQSPLVTLNGGASSPPPPAILRTSTVHQSTAYELTAVGYDLHAIEGAVLSAPNGNWEEPLEITSRAETTLTARGSFAAVVPQCVLAAGTERGQVAPATLPAEPTPPVFSESTLGSSCQETFRDGTLGPSVIQPKDFAFVPGGWTPAGTYVFHLFYIRQNQHTKNFPSLQGGIDSTEKHISHAVSNDVNLTQWVFADTARDTSAVRVRRGYFDSKHVWAPSVVRRGLTYYMFYTGVDSLGDQRMGLATSTDLFNWTQQEQPIYDFDQLGTWAMPKGPDGQLEAQFRDPFVMEYPEGSGLWVMYFVTIAEVSTPATMVGLAHSSGDFAQWGQDTLLYRTQHPGGSRVESPHVFERQGKWWLFYTAPEDSNPRAFAIAHPDDPTDPAATGWSVAQDINELIVDEYTGLPSGAFEYWKGTELLELSRANDVAFLAGYNDQAVGISYIRARTAEAPVLFEEDCPTDAVGVDRGSDRRSPPLLVLLGTKTGGAGIRFRMDVPAATLGRVEVFDITGRRVATLLEGLLPLGSTDVIWDGSGTGGVPVRAGVYFASLTAAGARSTVRAPLLR